MVYCKSYKGRNSFRKVFSRPLETSSPTFTLERPQAILISTLIYPIIANHINQHVDTVTSFPLGGYPSFLLTGKFVCIFNLILKCAELKAYSVYFSNVLHKINFSNKYACCFSLVCLFLFYWSLQLIYLSFGKKSLCIAI